MYVCVLCVVVNLPLACGSKNGDVNMCRPSLSVWQELTAMVGKLLFRQSPFSLFLVFSDKPVSCTGDDNLDCPLTLRVQRCFCPIVEQKFLHVSDIVA